ncbi:MAG: hypothetical protein NTX51_08445 [Verrucomicrobia bacterium]|nr:hypothetical protein [Verrucomicrobiota bacterium]
MSMFRIRSTTRQAEAEAMAYPLNNVGKSIIPCLILKTSTVSSLQR